MLFRISGNKNSLGKILDVNFEATIRLKYEREELMGTNIKRLLPSAIAARHDEWILRSYSSLVFNNVNRITQGFIQDKNGFYVFTNMLVKLIPNLKEGINFIAALQMNKRLSGYIRLFEAAEYSKKALCIFIGDEAGRVIGINSGAGDYFGISGREFNTKSEITLQGLIPMLTDPQFEKQIKSKEGYVSNINVQDIRKQIGETDRSEEGKAACETP